MPGRSNVHGKLADLEGSPVCDLVARVATMIRVDEIWLVVDPLDLRAGIDTALARVVRCSALRTRTTPICLPTAGPFG